MSIDWNKPVKTKNGLEVTIFSTKAEYQGMFTAVGVVHTGHTDVLARWNLKTGEGMFTYYDYSLVNIPDKQWANLYWNAETGQPCLGSLHRTLELARVSRNNTVRRLYLKTVEIEVPNDA